MYIWFIISIVGMCFMVPLHFLSVEHLMLQEKYGKERGIKIGNALGLISGWGFFIFWFGVWFSPQQHFIIPIIENLVLKIPLINLSISLIHFIISIPLIGIGAWFGIGSVRNTTLKVAETHRTEKIIVKGLYSKMRHPQYFGGVLAHIGISVLLSSLFSLIATPIIILLNFLISWKEEKELLKEFGKEYEDYKNKVPMFLPKLRKRVN